MITSGGNRDADTMGSTPSAESSASYDGPNGRPGLVHGERREALIAAAVQVVAKRGFRRLTYRSIAEEAGVAHGLVRHHFGTIDTLIVEALKHCCDVTLATIQLDPPSGDVEDFLQGLIESLQSDSETQLFQYEVMLESRRTESLRKPVADMLSLYKGIVRQGLSRMGLADDSVLVEFVYACLEGIALQETVQGVSPATDQAVSQLRRVISLLRSAERDLSRPGSVGLSDRNAGGAETVS
ncbi:TetR/AcrR family transcriptional regulator [Dietzia cinnamea]|uniref:TetR/AcrR family transcriptional regulator n=1 Tax=Dietzia cinnamea TaxID=321318 RepID=A0ABV3YGE1_9ACTN|nr:TetR/AcrR family transcriptional regulator [Dietzia sp. UCD-THP]EYT62474.1 hypothetical protein H483_0110355 [Dietzia sp. UCD-THP]